MKLGLWRLQPWRCSVIRKLILVLVFLFPLACSSPDSLPGVPVAPRWVPKSVLVKFRADSPPARVKEARIHIGAQSWERLPLADAERMSLDGSLDVLEALEKLGEYGDVVEYAEPDFLYEASGTPSDYDPDVLWGL